MIKDPFLHELGKEFYERLGVKFHVSEEFKGKLIIFERVVEQFYLCSYDINTGLIYATQSYPLDVINDIGYYQTVVLEFILAQHKNNKVMHFINFGENLRCSRYQMEQRRLCNLEKVLLDKLNNVKIFLHSNHQHRADFADYHIFRLPIGIGIHRLDRKLLRKLQEPELYNRKVTENCIAYMNRHYSFTIEMAAIEQEVMNSKVYQTIRYKNMTPIETASIIYNICKLKYFKVDELIGMLKATVYNKDKPTPPIKISKEHFRSVLTQQLKIFKIKQNRHFPLHEKNGRKCKGLHKGQRGQSEKIELQMFSLQ